MHRRSVLVALSLSLFACSYEAPAPSFGSSNQRESGSKAAKDDTTSTDSIDGTWDITATGDIHAASAMMTVAGGRVSGDILFEDEGTTTAAGCTIVKHRWHFEIDVVGDELTGRYGRDWVYGSEDPCPKDSHGLDTFTATRKHAASNADGQTAVEGEWQFKDNDGDDKAAMSVIGLAARLYSPRDKSQVITTSGTTSALKSTGDRTAFIFAARKR